MAPRTRNQPSDFWLRLTEAMSDIHWPTSQNGIAKKLGMSQGSVQRWYNGEGYPETKTILEICRRTKVSLDWLMLNLGQKRPERLDNQGAQLMRYWRELEPEPRARILRMAQLEHSARHTPPESNPRVASERGDDIMFAIAPESLTDTDVLRLLEGAARGTTALTSAEGDQA